MGGISFSKRRSAGGTGEDKPMRSDTPHGHHEGELIVPYETLFEVSMNALKATGVPSEEARMTVPVLLCADVRGIGTHGIEILLPYIERLKKGLINPRPKRRVQSLVPAVRSILGDRRSFI